MNRTVDTRGSTIAGATDVGSLRDPIQFHRVLPTLDFKTVRPCNSSYTTYRNRLESRTSFSSCLIKRLASRLQSTATPGSQKPRPYPPPPALMLFIKSLEK